MSPVGPVTQSDLSVNGWLGHTRPVTAAETAPLRDRGVGEGGGVGGGLRRFNWATRKSKEKEWRGSHAYRTGAREVVVVVVVVERVRGRERRDQQCDTLQPGERQRSVE